MPGSVPPAQAYYPAQGTRSRGYELELQGEPMPGWSVSVGWTQFSAKDAAGQDVNTSHPRKILRLFSSYRLPGAWSGLTLGGGVNWEGVNYTIGTNPAGNPERLEQPAYALVNLMARYDITPAWSAQLNVDNVFDKKYHSQIGFYDQLAFGAPRNVTLSLTARF
jgi:outer membrane receptor for ferric coprogen and ferric-rhodotorulic acid